MTVAFVGRSAAGSADFTLIALPDTQYYSSSLVAAVRQSSTRRPIGRANRAARNIVFVTQLGDCVRTGQQRQRLEWRNAPIALPLETATTFLTHGIPYASLWQP